MIDVTDLWPGASNGALSSFAHREPCQWLVLSNAHVLKLSMAKETHEEALMRGVPSNLKGRMKDAMLSLEREKILFSVPKEGHDVWHADSRHPFFQSDENIEVLEALRTCDSLRAALADGTPLLIREISPILEKSILKVWEKKIKIGRAHV